MASPPSSDYEFQGKRPLLSNTAKACLIGQVLSLLLAVMGTTSSILVQAGINAPTTQSFFNYCLLAISCSIMHGYQSGWRLRLTNPILTYVLLAILDVEGNYLVTLAYQYTSITSVTLLDSATIPFVMLLSVVVFRSHYRLGHMAGCLLCTGGLLLLVLTDGGSETGGANPVLGDALVVAGAAVYAVCNVVQELLLSTATSRWELLAMLGIFGSCISGAQAFVLERGAWQQAIAWGPEAAAAFAGFALSLYLFYILVPDVLVLGSSTILNLSLLTSDLWAGISRLVMFQGFGGTAWAFALALTAESVGLGLYAASGETHKRVGSGGAAATAEHAGLLSVNSGGSVDGCKPGTGGNTQGKGWRAAWAWLLPTGRLPGPAGGTGHGKGEKGEGTGDGEDVSLMAAWQAEEGRNGMIADATSSSRAHAASLQPYVMHQKPQHATLPSLDSKPSLITQCDTDQSGHGVQRQDEGQSFQQADGEPAAGNARIGSVGRDRMPTKAQVPVTSLIEWSSVGSSTGGISPSGTGERCTGHGSPLKEWSSGASSGANTEMVQLSPHGSMPQGSGVRRAQGALSGLGPSSSEPRAHSSEAEGSTS